MRRTPLLALGAFGLAAWCAPMLALALWLSSEAKALGVEATASGLRPAWPLGVSARKVSFTRGTATLPIKDLELLWGPGGWTGEALIGTWLIQSGVGSGTHGWPHAASGRLAAKASVPRVAMRTSAMR